MSTNDVPGANPVNNDKLAMGAWAEHADGSLILVESTEGNRAIYSVFDLSKEPPIEFRDAMPEVSFKTTYSWKPGGKAAGTPNEKWTWHDKTPFPWDRIIKKGGRDGFKSAAADHTVSEAAAIAETRNRHRRPPVEMAHLDEEEVSTAAARVAKVLRLQGQEFDRENAGDRLDQIRNRLDIGFGGIKRALDRLPGAIATALKPKKRAGGR